MRGIGAGFGMVAFLIAIALSLWMWSTYTAEVVKYGKPAEKQAQQIAGYDDAGRPALQSIRMTAEEKNGKLEAMRVDLLRDGGAFHKYFTLLPDDRIIAAGPFNFRGYEYDEEMAKALILAEYQKKGQLTILRNGKKMIVPVPTDGSWDGFSNTEGDTSPGLVATPTTKPVAEEEKAEKPLPKELAPLKGILR